jgi:superfamily II DNA or RNA helicase
MDSPLPLDAIDAGINGVVCKITGQPAARRAQITALRRLVYERRDTILIAATGFGKSAVLFAFWLLTKKITILIVPLTKLGENQRDDIAKNVEGSNPVWIDADTHLKVSQMKRDRHVAVKLTKLSESQSMGASPSWRLHPRHP